METYHPNKLMPSILFSMIIISLVVIAVISASLITKVFLSGILWISNGEFDMTRHDVWRITKMGIGGGGIMGVGIVLLRLFKVKGF
ncbi:hypothetical protein [Martelella alba]|uniref:Uncharacterized protein n=1 Tax=Martelella alba TaxID=2590451 RepID=A0ABY2SD11_9HYPH|nr:hypothetical protein [Martelella alba]TKI01676.1 hypothetical protein FCN80_26240 [Martelella alba]